MSSLRLILLTLLYHWRIQAAVACGVAAGTAVLTGALLVGDSMRGSLRQLALERLGRIDEALVGDRFFRGALGDELAAARNAEVAPVILLRVSIENSGPETPVRANQVNLIGCDERFWRLGSGRPDPLPQGLEVVLNRPLAERLGVEPGQPVSLALPRPSTIPSESAFGRREQTVQPQRFTVSGIIPAEGFGRFTLSPNQQLPLNAYVPLDWLQDRLRQPGHVNSFLVAGEGDEEIEAHGSAWQPKLEDYGIQARTITRTGGGFYVNITSDRMILDPAAEEEILPQLRESGEGKTPLVVQPALTYLANTIACGGREIPYSTITAVDFIDRPPLGPMLTPEGKPIGRLADDEIAINSWAAEDLSAKPGDVVRLTYFEPESVHGEVRERTVEFRLAAIIALAGVADDPAFTPEVPGVTDRRTIKNWDLPFPFESDRVRPKDEKYWDQHRGAPKAYVSLAAGQKLWASRFGRVTSIRVAGDRAAIESLKSGLTLDPDRMGFVLQPVKEQGLASAAGTTPFEWLFIGFSFFIIAAAAMLVAILFRLGIAGRANQIGILRAVGFEPRQIGRMLMIEGLLVAALGSLLGLAAGIGYAALMLAGLKTWWLAAIVTPFLRLHWTYSSLAIGYLSGIVVAILAIWWSARRAGRTSPRQLLGGDVSEQRPWIAARPRYSAATMWVLIALALGIGGIAIGLDQDMQALAFFGAGAMVLAAALVFTWSRLIAGRTGSAVAVGRGNLLRLATRNAARHPGRSTLTIGLVAAATFLIVAISAFRADPTQTGVDLRSGNGGFALTAESDHPIFADLNSPEGRADLGLSDEDSKLLADASTLALRMKPGDDASCLNLYRPQRPRVLGVPRQLVEHGGFAWSGSTASNAEERANPWLLLNQELEPDDDGVPRVPVVLDANTAMYSLKTGLRKAIEIDDGRGGKLRLVVVGLLGGSIFQGDLLIGEEAFLRHFPEQSGYRFFLVETPLEQSAAVQNALERGLADYGLAAEPTPERLARFLAVQNTYLSTFQSLGGLGLLLGTFGLAAVQLRSVLERRRELALLRATGFRRRTLGALVTLENSLLLAGGLASGLVAALVAVLPHFFSGRAAIPWGSTVATLVIVLVVGLAAGLVAVRAAVAAPLLAALRAE